MSEKKQLNNEELEKVSGGLKEAGNIRVFEPNEILNLSTGDTVSIYIIPRQKFDNLNQVLFDKK